MRRWPWRCSQRAGCSELISASRPAAGRAHPDRPPKSRHRRRPKAARLRRPARNDATGPSTALLAQSRAQRAAGSYAQAQASVERALQIDPNNAALWVELGEIDLATGNAAQAATLARKALTLAAPNDSIAIADAQKLLRAACAGSASRAGLCPRPRS